MSKRQIQRMSQHQRWHFERATQPRVLPFHPQKGYMTPQEPKILPYNGYHYGQPRHHQHLQQPRYVPPLINGAPYNGKPFPSTYNNNTAPGTMLFSELKNYANNLYSLKLMQLDLQRNMATSQKSKEHKRILESLNRSQVQLRNPDITKAQWTKIECLTRQLCEENTRLASLEYESKKDEIFSVIQKLLTKTIKFIPSYQRIINYVTPNMRKRRFFDLIHPEICQDIERLINNLCEEHHFQTTSERGMHHPNLSSKSQVPPTLPHRNLHNPLRESHEPHENSPMDLNNFQTKNGKKRTRDVNSDISYSPSSSLDDVSSTRISRSHEKAKRPYTNNVNTVEEAFTKMKTFASHPLDQPTLSKAPDTPDTSILTENNSEAMDNELKITLAVSSTISLPHHSLVTLHGEKHEKLNLISHVTIQITPQTLSNLTILNKLPLESNILYEIFLTNETFSKFQNSLADFLCNAKLVNLPFILTIPEAKIPNISQLSSEFNLHEIDHPFRNVPNTTSTT
jgi:hypothetical protein